MSQKVCIEPPISVNVFYDSMEIQVLNLELNKSATINVIFFYAGEYVKVQTFKLEGQAYQDWKTDDYISNWVLSQLNK